MSIWDATYFISFVVGDGRDTKLFEFPHRKLLEELRAEGGEDAARERVPHG